MTRICAVGALALLATASSLACRPRTQTTPRRNPPPPSRHIRNEPVRSQAEDVAQLGSDIQRAADSLSEAGAIKRLREYAARNNLTYQVASVSIADGAPVRSPSAQPVRVRTTIQLFRKLEPVYAVTFVPQDNRNLALLGE